MHEFLIRQNIEYQLIVVNQADDGLFNRGALLNIGFLEVSLGQRCTNYC
jgi:hypothetical protein